MCCSQCLPRESAGSQENVLLYARLETGKTVRIYYYNIYRLFDCSNDNNAKRTGKHNIYYDIIYRTRITLRYVTYLRVIVVDETKINKIQNELNES